MVSSARSRGNMTLISTMPLFLYVGESIDYNSILLLCNFCKIKMLMVKGFLCAADLINMA